uniref:Galactosylgalactosylxylosylprotein 3-beta-glucuronosyltransferase n=1 Tax=Panagrolaimus sp. JU765 TaxID=591449 RepID=A0AC34QVC0_9BILA
MAIKHLEDCKDKIVGSKNSVVYFADDDNSYDTRLFDEYIRNIKKAGVWAVGLVGGSPVEAPIVENGKVKGWHVSWNPERKFAVDMAGFAVSAHLIFKNHPRFGTECKKGGGAPETCFLESVGVKLSDLQAFGFEVVSIGFFAIIAINLTGNEA